MTGSAPNEWLSGKEAAAWLGVSLAQWYRGIAPHVAGHRVSGKPNGLLRYRREDLEAWVAAQRVEPKSTQSAG